ncbi:ABC transporter permease [Lusitaniella coriacea LEGE 07167]
MATPIIALVLGTVLLLCATSIYIGNSLWKETPILYAQRGNKLWFLGCFLIASALILGTIGYLGYIPVSILRPLRIISGSAGLFLIGYRFYRSKSAVKQFYIDIKRYWELLSVLVPQNLHTRYRGSFLGIYWSLLNPLIMMGIYTAIFGAAFASYYNDSITNYILAAFTGLVITNFYSASTSQALASVVGNGSLLNKIRLPVGIFPVSMIAANLFQFAMGIFPLLAVMTVIITKKPLNALVLFLPIISLTLVCMGVGFLMSALFVFFRDLGYFYELVCFVLWITSPVFYPSEIVPEAVQPFLAFNPLVPIIENLREITLSGTLPSLSSLGGSLLSGILILAFGWAFFQWLRPRFMDLL